MLSQEDIEVQQELLATHRRTLAHLLTQRAKFSAGYIPAHIANGIREARDNIARIKGNLQSWGISVEDLPDDQQDGKPDLSSGRRPSILIDSTPLLGDKGDIWPIQYDKCECVDDLLDDIFIAMDGGIPSLTYGTFWVLRDKRTGQAFLDIGTKWANEQLAYPWDNRGLAEVGIHPNTTLEVIACGTKS